MNVIAPTWVMWGNSVGEGRDLSQKHFTQTLTRPQQTSTHGGQLAKRLKSSGTEDGC